MPGGVGAWVRWVALRLVDWVSSLEVGLEGLLGVWVGKRHCAWRTAPWLWTRVGFWAVGVGGWMVGGQVTEYQSEWVAVIGG